MKEKGVWKEPKVMHTEIGDFHYFEDDNTNTAGGIATGNNVTTDNNFSQPANENNFNQPADNTGLTGQPSSYFQNNNRIDANYKGFSVENGTEYNQIPVQREDEIGYNFRRDKERELQQSMKPNSYQNDYLGRIKAKQIVEKQRCMRPTQPSSLQFDGKNLTWLQNGQPVKSYPAQSGHNGFQSEQYTNVSNEGPIPEGYYMLNKDSGQDYKNDFWHKIRRYPPVSWLTTENWTNKPAAWGHQRIPIHARSGTNTYGRTNMYIHGGDNGFGSAGCIDLERGMPNFYKDWLEYDDDLSLEVKYPRGW